ncbi:ABC transporter permease [bacterium]|nr:ABC transporter permease [bacterium]MCK4437262.1 ABC transporter permease [bacterium]
MNVEIRYTPSGPVYKGISGPFRHIILMFRELISARELIWRLFLRDFSARYRQSVLGVAWAVLMPLATVGVFVILNRSGVLEIGKVPIPYPAYALLGLTVWNLFSVGIAAASNSIINAGPMVVKINFPKISLVIASIGQAIVSLFIMIFLLIVIFLWYGIAPNVSGIFLSFLALLPLYLLTLGLGFILSLAAGVLRDIPNIMGIATYALMLLTPVLYPTPRATAFEHINLWNPLNYMVNGVRDLVLAGTMKAPFGYLYSAIFAVIVFLLGWRVFYFAQTKIAERV